jgi:hypothetical protein
VSFFEESFKIQRNFNEPMGIGKAIFSLPEYPVSGCPNIVETFPYIESWESGNGLWENPSSNNHVWGRQAGNTGSSGTGPNGAYDGSYYMYTEASGTYNTWFEMTSPCFNLTLAESASFSFYWSMYGATMGTLYVEAAIVDGSGSYTWEILFTRSGNYGNPIWVFQQNDLVDFLGNFVKIRFRYISGSSYTGDCAVDYIVLDTVIGDVNIVKGSNLFIPVQKTLRL